MCPLPRQGANSKVSFKWSKSTNSLLIYLLIWLRLKPNMRWASHRFRKRALNSQLCTTPLKKYNFPSNGEKAAASMANGRWAQRCWRGVGELAVPSGVTVQKRFPRNTRTVRFWSETQTHTDTPQREGGTVRLYQRKPQEEGSHWSCRCWSLDYRF